jgi:phosphate/sulfate permease
MELVLIFLVSTVVLSIVDLTVGVANDAVNFLNSAVGSKVTSFKRALLFASIGILIGVTLSSGMMEVARKGIFNPSAFTLTEVMIIFLATVITDILLLDFFNTYGIPTSTTVSMVSALSGGALGLSLIHIVGDNQSFEKLSHYMNLSKLTVIYVSIIISIIFAFIFGYLGQFLSRLIFSFDYKKIFRFVGPLWSSFAFTFILFFVSVKGLEGASFITPELNAFIKTHRIEILGVTFLFFSIIFYLGEIFKINVLKIVVLIGTSALALSFASNDLVNFIGPAYASFASYQLALAHPDPLNMKMDALANPIPARTEILLFCGLIMVLTLFFSKKARSVTATEVDLGRQVEGYEAFQSFAFARFLVRFFTSVSENMLKIVPKSLREKINSRFDASKIILLSDDKGQLASFDLIRATMNLTIASALISLGTSLKLPLSTTYITFIVAMSTALADRAWSRDYAVFRISGILVVIGGWFLTAVVCGIVSGAIAIFLFYSKILGLVILIGFVVLTLARTAILHKRKSKERKREEEKLLAQKANFAASFEIFVKDVNDFLINVKDIANYCVTGISKYKLKELKKANKLASELNSKVDNIFVDFAKSLRGFEDHIFESSHIYASAMADLSFISSSIVSLTQRCFEYVDNSRKPLTDNQITDLKVVTNLFNQMYERAIQIAQDEKAIGDGEAKNLESEFSKEIKRIHKTYMKALKRPTANARRGIIFISLVEGLYSLVVRILNLVNVLNQLKSQLATVKNKVDLAK